MRLAKVAKNVAPYFALFLLSVAFTSPLFKNPHNTGANDWDMFCFNDEVARVTILKYHQFPLWNPYSSGGRPLLANQQTRFLSPTFIFTLVFGCVLGLKIESLVMIFIGMVGMFLLARYFKMNSLASLFTASVFGLSSVFSLHMAEGHVMVFALTTVPYTFLFFLKSFEKRFFLAFSAISLVIMFLLMAGSPIMALIPFSIFLACYCIILSVQKRSWIPLIHFFILFALMFAFGAVKILPTMEYAITHPRVIESPEFISLQGVGAIFLSDEQRLGAHHFDAQTWGWHEYGAYTGIIPLLLFVFGIIFLWKKELPLIISGLLLLTIALGDFASWSPWHLLHKLPFFESLRVPSRFIGMFIFCLAILSGLALNMFSKGFKISKKLSYLAVILVIFVAHDLYSVNHQAFAQAFINAPKEIVPSDYFIQIVDAAAGRSGARSSMYINLHENKGTLNSYDPVGHQVSAKGFNETEYKGEIYLEEGNASYVYWSPNRLTADVSIVKPTRLIINQNFDKGWHVKGGKAENFNGLLSTNVTSSGQVVFYYMPTSFIVGTIITALSIVFVILLCVKSKNESVHIYF